MILAAGTPFAERIDPHTLRGSPLDPAALQQVFADERARQATLAGQELRRSLTVSGTAARMLGNGQAAIADLRRALDLSADDEPHQTLGRVRLAEAYRVVGDSSAVEHLLADLTATVDTLAKPSAATVHQHLGKFAFDRGDFACAAGHFARALELRKSGGDPELIESSRVALHTARQRLTAGQ